MISDPSIDRFIRLQSPLFNVGQCHKKILWAKLEVHKVDNINRISRFLGVSVSPASASLSLEDFAHCIRIVGDMTTQSSNGNTVRRSTIYEQIIGLRTSTGLTCVDGRSPIRTCRNSFRATWNSDRHTLAFGHLSRIDRNERTTHAIVVIEMKLQGDQ